MSGAVCEQGAAQAVPAIEARSWLAAWSDNGGIAMIVGNHLYVSRLAGLDKRASQRLDNLRGWIVRPGAGQALAGVLTGLASLYEGDAA